MITQTNNVMFIIIFNSIVVIKPQPIKLCFYVFTLCNFKKNKQGFVMTHKISPYTPEKMPDLKKNKIKYKNMNIIFAQNNIIVT